MSLSVTRKIYSEYYKNSDLVKADINWENGFTDEIFTMNNDEKVYASGTVRGKPVFEDGVLESLNQPSLKTMRWRGGTMISKSKNWCCIIPGGFRNGPTANKMNPVRYEIGGLSALQGLLHIIAIPNQRITNCVTVEEKDLSLIDEGIQLLEITFFLLLHGGEDEIGSVRWQLNQSGNIKMNNDDEYSLECNENDFVVEDRELFNELKMNINSSELDNSLNKLKLSVTCHGDKNASIRKLHLHGFSSNLKTIAYEKMEEKAKLNGSQKNIPIQHVIDMAKNGETSRLKYLCLKNNPEYIDLTTDDI
jgi:hypothetical protein